jgi:Flavin reductase like domain
VPRTAAPAPAAQCDHGAFRHVVGHFATGVTVIAARHEGQRFGMTASAVTSLSLGLRCCSSASTARPYPKAPPAAVSVTVRWAQGQVITDVLKKACDHKDLTRQGVVTALHQLSNLDTGGLVAAPLDYTKIGQPSERAVYIAKIDKQTAGGTKSIAVAESANAKSYNEAQ